MRLSCVLLCLAACDESAELRAWRSHRADLAAEQLRLASVPPGDAGAQRLAALEERWSALEGQLQLVAVVRSLDAGVKAFAEGEGVTLSFAGTLSECLEVVRTLEPARPLTDWWSLRLGPGQCQWQAREAHDLHAFFARLASVETSWKAPARQWSSFGLGRVQADCEDLEQQLSRRRAELGPLSRLPMLEERDREGQALRDVRGDAGMPCDLLVLERAVAHGDDALLEVRSDALVHPLEPLSDPRLAGLVVRGSEGLEWRCPR